MSKTFRPWKIDEPLLFPPCVRDFVGDDHLARFVVGLVLEHLDLGEIAGSYGDERGQPPFDVGVGLAGVAFRRQGVRRRRLGRPSG